MSKILIVGNVIKDVYLALDERHNKLEQGDQAPWLDLHLNGGSYPYFNRNNIFGGAAIALSILTEFDIPTTIAGNDLRFDQNEVKVTHKPDDYRYIFYHNNNGAHFRPTQYHPTKWVEPAERPDWIFIDYSAHLPVETAAQIRSYLELNTSTRLVLFVPRELNKSHRLLLDRADLVFVTDAATFPLNISKQICLITDDSIQIDHHVQIWHVDSLELTTRLVAYSVIAATVLAALVKGRPVAEALLMAKLNIENSTLDGTVPEEKLIEMSQQRKLEQVDLRILAASYLSADQQNVELKNAIIDFTPDDLLHIAQKLQRQYQQGKRFARWAVSPNQDEFAVSDLTARQAFFCQNADIVPVIQYPFEPTRLLKNMQLYGVDLRACVLQTEKGTLLAQSAVS